MCTCFFCTNNKPHPKSHDTFERMSDRLAKAESLDPNDSVAQYFCTLCGHVVTDPPAKGSW